LAPPADAIGMEDYSRETEGTDLSVFFNFAAPRRR
jgi:hypothetical protein